MLYDFLSKNRGEVCGRYSSQQLGRPISLPRQPQSRLYRIAVGLGLVLIFTQTPAAQAKRPPLITEQICTVTDYNEDFEPQSGLGSIAGSAYDEKGNPAKGAQVELISNGSVLFNTTTDSNGRYSFQDNVSAGYYDVKITVTGYRTMIVTSVLVTAYEFSSVKFYLQKITGASDAPIINNYRPAPERKLMGKMKLK